MNSKIDHIQDSGESIGIVFLHHQVDQIAANNLQSFRDQNPFATIVTMSAAEPFPGGYSIQDLPGYCDRWKEQISKHELIANSPDLLVYAWYAHKREYCDRWVIVEWDAFCGMPIKEFFAPVWNFDLVAPTVRWPNREPDWYWFSTLLSLPHVLHPYAAGIVPFCFLLVRDQALAAICARVPWSHLGDCNGELRFGTLAHSCGFSPVANPMAGWNITWQSLPETTPVHSGMWHPVKWLVPRRHIKGATSIS